MTKFITRAIINGIALHGLASWLWYVGFACAMSAFDRGEYVIYYHIISFFHNLIFLPIVLLEYMGISIIDGAIMRQDTFVDAAINGTIGPTPSVASVIWSIMLCGLLSWFFQWARKKIKTWKEGKPKEDSTSVVA